MEKIKQRMNEQGIEVLLITNPSNMNYISGYDAWSFYVHQMLVVIIDEEQPIWIGREMDANGVKLTTWIGQDNIISYSDDYIHSTTKHPMEFVANILKEIGQATRNIGVEMETHYFSARSYERLQSKLPDASFFDASTLVNWVRIIKSDSEIEYMKKAANIVELAMQKGYETINVGVRECDVAANIFHSQVKGTDQFGGDYPAIVPMLPSGIKTSTPHITWSDERYKHGDTVILELAGCYKRYHSPMARTLVIGNPSTKVSDLSQVVLEGINETLAAIKPGLTCEEVEEVWRKSIEKKGYQKKSRIGYSVGLSYPPDWGEHTASLRKGDHTVLQPNMVFHLIPGIWYDDYGVEISETFRVTETGIETLANFPRELYIKS
ncbi:M24 family metallopeptidase [Anaerobacillus sp. MEB173]|uniref:M24 family metallopeptidase n=1 Tax=Anaerobacillus sp. MEB173 TaxID=3383345 RepID=UPI003F8E8E88